MHTSLYKHFLQIRTAALRAADPSAGVRRALGADDAVLRVGSSHWPLGSFQRVLGVAVGKAALTMAQAASECLGERLSAGILVSTDQSLSVGRPPAPWHAHPAGHPLPDERGLHAAQQTASFLQQAGPRDRILALISGGASALLPLPAPGLTLADLQAVSTALLNSGATIAELNAVRKHLERIKGGGMARLAAPAPLSALILSDVVGDTLDVIAGGPTVPDPTTYADAWAVLEKYALLDHTPPAVVRHLQAGLAGRIPETPFPKDPLFAQITHHLIGSNRQAALAACQEAERLGYRSLLLTSKLEGEARRVGRVIAALARSARWYDVRQKPSVCLVLGGETTVTVRGSGQGGRNQELALAAAIDLDGIDGAAVMALATDGRDGPTDAAGAIVDGHTMALARGLGLDPAAALNNNDAYPFLEKVGALMFTGPTGANVGDVTVILVG